MPKKYKSFTELLRGEGAGFNLEIYLKSPEGQRTLAAITENMLQEARRQQYEQFLVLQEQQKAKKEDREDDAFISSSTTAEEHHRLQQTGHGNIKAVFEQNRTELASNMLEHLDKLNKEFEKNTKEIEDLKNKINDLALPIATPVSDNNDSVTEAQIYSPHRLIEAEDIVYAVPLDISYTAIPEMEPQQRETYRYNKPVPKAFASRTAKSKEEDEAQREHLSVLHSRLIDRMETNARILQAQVVVSQLLCGLSAPQPVSIIKAQQNLFNTQSLFETLRSTHQTLFDNTHEVSRIRVVL